MTAEDQTMTTEDQTLTAKDQALTAKVQALFAASVQPNAGVAVVDVADEWHRQRAYRQLGAAFEDMLHYYRGDEEGSYTLKRNIDEQRRETANLKYYLRVHASSSSILGHATMLTALALSGVMLSVRCSSRLYRLLAQPPGQWLGHCRI